MAKQSGLGDNLYVAGHDASGDVGSVGTIRGGLATLDVTAINKMAFERIGGLRSGALEYLAFFNPAEDGTHEKLSALPTADQLLMYCRGTALGAPVACLNAKQINYDGSRANDGAFTFAVQSEGTGYGLEWCEQLTPGLRTDTAATDGDSVDLLAATEFGLQAYLQITALEGDDVTITIQESSDDGGADTWADVVGGAFAEATAIGSQRIETARDLAVEQHLRVVTSGTFTSVTFCVAVAKNITEVKF